MAHQSNCATPTFGNSHTNRISHQQHQHQQQQQLFGTSLTAVGGGGLFAMTPPIGGSSAVGGNRMSTNNIGGGGGGLVAPPAATTTTTTVSVPLGVPAASTAAAHPLASKQWRIKFMLPGYTAHHLAAAIEAKKAYEAEETEYEASKASYLKQQEILKERKKRKIAGEGEKGEGEEAGPSQLLATARPRSLSNAAAATTTTTTMGVDGRGGEGENEEDTLNLSKSGASTSSLQQAPSVDNTSFSTFSFSKKALQERKEQMRRKANNNDDENNNNNNDDGNEEFDDDGNVLLKPPIPPRKPNTDPEDITEVVLFEVHPRYDRLKEIARGSYGFVAAGADTKHVRKLRQRYGIANVSEPKVKLNLNTGQQATVGGVVAAAGGGGGGTATNANTPVPMMINVTPSSTIPSLLPPNTTHTIGGAPNENNNSLSPKNNNNNNTDINDFLAITAAATMGQNNFALSSCASIMAPASPFFTNSVSSVGPFTAVLAAAANAASSSAMTINANSPSFSPINHNNNKKASSGADTCRNDHNRDSISLSSSAASSPPPARATTTTDNDIQKSASVNDSASKRKNDADNKSNSDKSKTHISGDSSSGDNASETPMAAIILAKKEKNDDASETESQQQSPIGIGGVANPTNSSSDFAPNTATNTELFYTTNTTAPATADDSLNTPLLAGAGSSSYYPNSGTCTTAPGSRQNTTTNINTNTTTSPVNSSRTTAHPSDATSFLVFSSAASPTASPPPNSDCSTAAVALTTTTTKGGATGGASSSEDHKHQQHHAVFVAMAEKGEGLQHDHHDAMSSRTSRDAKAGKPPSASTTRANTATSFDVNNNIEGEGEEDEVRSTLSFATTANTVIPPPSSSSHHRAHLLHDDGEGINEDEEDEIATVGTAEPGRQESMMTDLATIASTSISIAAPVVVAKTETFLLCEDEEEEDQNNGTTASSAANHHTNEQQPKIDPSNTTTDNTTTTNSNFVCFLDSDIMTSAALDAAVVVTEASTTDGAAATGNATTATADYSAVTKTSAAAASPSPPNPSRTRGTSTRRHKDPNRALLTINTAADDKDGNDNDAEKKKADSHQLDATKASNNVNDKNNNNSDIDGDEDDDSGSSRMSRSVCDDSSDDDFFHDFSGCGGEAVGSAEFGMSAPHSAVGGYRGHNPSFVAVGGAQTPIPLTSPLMINNSYPMTIGNRASSAASLKNYHQQLRGGGGGVVGFPESPTSAILSSAFPPPHHPRGTPVPTAAASTNTVVTTTEDEGDDWINISNKPPAPATIIIPASLQQQQQRRVSTAGSGLNGGLGSAMGTPVPSSPSSIPSPNTAIVVSSSACVGANTTPASLLVVVGNSGDRGGGRRGSVGAPPPATTSAATPAISSTHSSRNNRMPASNNSNNNAAAPLLPAMAASANNHYPNATADENPLGMRQNSDVIGGGGGNMNMSTSTPSFANYHSNNINNGNETFSYTAVGGGGGVPSNNNNNKQQQMLQQAESDSEWEPDEAEWLDPNVENEDGQLPTEEDIRNGIDEVSAVAIKKITVFDPDDPPEVQSYKALCACRELGFLCFVNPKLQLSLMSADKIWIPIHIPKGSGLTRASIRKTISEFRDVYIIMQKMERTLAAFIKAEPPNAGARMLLLFRIIAGVAYMHVSGFIHRDLKPENILISLNFGIKIMDFGQGRDFDTIGRESFTTRVGLCTLLYASPETLRLEQAVETDNFSPELNAHSADMWSVGCIASEMITGTPIFNPKKDGPLHQLDAIAQIRGLKSDIMGKLAKHVHPSIVKADPPDTFSECLESRRVYSVEEEVEQHEEAWEEEKTRNLLNLEKELICQLLSMSAQDRPTALSALRHPFFDPLRKDDMYRVKETIEALEDLALNKRVFESEAVERCKGDFSRARQYIWDLFLQKNPSIKNFIDKLVVDDKAET